MKDIFLIWIFFGIIIFFIEFKLWIFIFIYLESVFDFLVLYDMVDKWMWIIEVCINIVVFYICGMFINY